MILIEEAREIIQANTRILEGHQIPLVSALGQILDEDVRSDGNYPTADRSMMDGYVLREEGKPGTYRVVGEIPAATVPEKGLHEGEAMRIFTGAMLPENGGRVVMQEDCVREDSTVQIKEFQESLFIRKKASEARTGEIVLARGTLLAPPEMAILAQVGCVTPKVIRRPVIRHLATGDELVAPQELPEAGKIRDTNSTLLQGQFAALGLEIISSRISDDPAAMKKILQDEADLFLISGGASVGDYDHGATVLRDAGFTIHFDKVNLRPGKPLTFATRGNQSAFVIPGNPVSHFVCFHIAILQAVELMWGRIPRWDFIDLEISDSHIIRPSPRETMWPASVFVENSRLLARPLAWSTSGNTFSLAGANALIRVTHSGKWQTLLLDLPHPPA